MDLFKQILSGYVRHGLTAFAGYLFARGLIQQGDQQILISAALAIAGVAWSTANKVIHDYELRNAANSLPPATSTEAAK